MATISTPHARSTRHPYQISEGLGDGSLDNKGQGGVPGLRNTVRVNILFLEHVKYGPDRTFNPPIGLGLLQDPAVERCERCVTQDICYFLLGAPVDKQLDAPSILLFRNGAISHASSMNKTQSSQCTPRKRIARCNAAYSACTFRGAPRLGRGYFFQHTRALSPSPNPKYK